MIGALAQVRHGNGDTARKSKKSSHAVTKSALHSALDSSWVGIGISSMIAAIPATHHRILERRTFDVTAREIVQQDVKLRREQLAVARGEMALQRRLVRQEVIEGAIQPAVVDRPVWNVQQIVERRRRIPPLFNRQLAPGRAEPVDREDRDDARPRDVSGRIVQAGGEERVQSQLVPERPARAVRAPIAASAPTAPAGPAPGSPPHRRVAGRPPLETVSADAVRRPR